MPVRAAARRIRFIERGRGCETLYLYTSNNENTLGALEKRKRMSCEQKELDADTDMEITHLPPFDTPDCGNKLVSRWYAESEYHRSICK